MSLICQLETDIEIKAPADKFHEVFSCRPHHMSNVSPEKIQGVELHEGEWGKVGSIISWNYMHGKPTIIYFVIFCFSFLNYQNFIVNNVSLILKILFDRWGC